MTRDEIKSLLIDHGIYHPSGALLDRLASAGASVVPKESTATDEVSVTQADRDAAAGAWHKAFGKSHVEDRIAAIIHGEDDAHPLVQAFARHRTASEQSRVGWTKAELGKWAEGWSRTPATTLKAFIDAGLCSDQSPAREETRLVRRSTSQPTPAERTLLTLVDTMREYLPSDGISKDEFIQRILEALDNDEMAKLIGELEAGK